MNKRHIHEPKAGDGWKENAEYLLAHCPHTIRVCDTEHPDTLLTSLVVTFQRMQTLLERPTQPPGAEVERMRKLFYLAAQEVIFFSTYDQTTDTWHNVGEFYSPCVNLGDTFAYACADGERLDDSEIDRLITAHKRWGYDGVVAWASLIRKCEPIRERRTEAYVEARSALTKVAGHE